MNKSIIFIIIFLVVAGILGNIIYNNVYTSRVNEEIKNAGLNPNDYDFDKNMSAEEVRQVVLDQEISKILLEAGISPEEIDLSGLDFTGLSSEEVYDLVYQEAVKQKTQQQTSITQNTKTITSSSQVQQTDVYNCISDSNVSKRGYIVIHGAGGPDAGETTIKNAVSNDPNYAGFLYFKYDANKELLQGIASRFVSEFNTFSAQDFDEIIIYGQSAGGVIASYSANNLNTSSKIEIHTLASPLNGYKFGPASTQTAQQFTGLNKEIGLGIDPYKKPSDNVSVYHHKTVEDQTLRSFCGSYASLCSPSVIQNNNVPGSLEFSYPNDTHDSIANTVITKTLSCKK